MKQNSVKYSCFFLFKPIFKITKNNDEIINYDIETHPFRKKNLRINKLNANKKAKKKCKLNF